MDGKIGEKDCQWVGTENGIFVGADSSKCKKIEFHQKCPETYNMPCGLCTPRDGACSTNEDCCSGNCRNEGRRVLGKKRKNKVAKPGTCGNEELFG